MVPRPAGTRSRHPYTRCPGLPRGRTDGRRAVDEARAAANGLIDAAEATRNPWCSRSRCTPTATPSAMLIPSAHWRPAPGLVIAQDSGNRYAESLLAGTVCRVEAEHGDPLAALDYATLTIRTFHDAGNTALMRSHLAILAALLDRLDAMNRRPPSSGSHPVPSPRRQSPHHRHHPPPRCPRRSDLRIARHKGETMTTAAMATYAYDQIEPGPTELNAVSK